MTQDKRDWQKDMDWAQRRADAGEYEGWTEPLMYWLQEAASEKARADAAEAREQRLKEAVAGLRKGIETIRNLDAGEVYLSEVQFSLGNLLALYPDTPKENKR